MSRPRVNYVSAHSKRLVAGEEEIANWSRTPVAFHFGTGWRLRDEPEVSKQSSESPADYTALFPLPVCDHTGEEEPWCDECEDFLISPRTAAVLATALTVLADECRMDIEEHGDEPVEQDGTWMWFDELPRITWQQDAAWRGQFAQAANALLADIDSGQHPRPRCPGEEMAFHLALRSAKGVVDMMSDSEDYKAEVVGNLPEHPQDYDWDSCFDVLLEDSDILFLYDQAADGIEDPETEINKHFGIGDMRPANWFQPQPDLPERDSAED